MNKTTPEDAAALAAKHGFRALINLKNLSDLTGLAALIDEVRAIQPPRDERWAWNSLTDADRERAFNSLPDMLDGFLKKWGWLHFAQAIEDICREKNFNAAEPAQPVALSTLTDEQIEASAAHHNGELDDGVWMFHCTDFYRLARVFAASAPAQQAGQSEPIGWLKPNESYAPDAFRWARTDTHIRPLFFANETAAPPQPVAAEVEKDAQRYRWLRDLPIAVPTNGLDVAWWDDYHGEGIRGEKLDAAIDNAMAGTGSDESKENGNG